MKKAFLILLLAGVVLVVSLFIFIQSRAFLTLAGDIAGRRTGGTVEIGSLALEGVHGIVIRDVTITGGVSGDFTLRLPYTEVGFSPLGLLRKRLGDITVKDPVLSLTAGAPDKGPVAGAGGRGVSVPFTFRRLTVTGAEIVLRPDNLTEIKGLLDLDMYTSGQDSTAADRLDWRLEASVRGLSVYSADLNIDFRDRLLKLNSRGAYDIRAGHMAVELLDVQLEDTGELILSGVLKNVFSSAPGIDMKVKAAGISLDGLKRLVSGPAVEWLDDIKTDGYLEADIAVAGDIESPALNGLVSVQGGSLETEDIGLASFDIRVPFAYKDLLIRSDAFHITAERAVFSGNGAEPYTLRGVSVTGVLEGDPAGRLFRLEPLTLESEGIKGIKGNVLLNFHEPAVINAAFDYTDDNIQGLVQKFSPAPGFSMKGKLDVKTAVTVTIPGETAPQVAGSVSLSLSDAGFSSDDETVIAEGVSMNAFAGFRFPLPLERIDVAVSSQAGGFELLAGRFYGDFSDKKVRLSAKLGYSPDTDMLEISRAELSLTGAGSVLAAGEISGITTSAAFDTDVRLVNISIEDIYDFFIRETFQEQMPGLSQITVNGTASANMHLKGRINGFTARGDITIDDMNINESDGDIHLTGVNLHLPVDISYPDAPRPGEAGDFGFLGIDDLSLAGVQLRNLRAFPAVRRNTLLFREDIRLPLFGGSIAFRNITCRDILSPERELSLSVDIKDIDLSRAGAVFDMPAFEGTMSGSIPKVSFMGNRLLTEGEIVIDVFNGRIKATGLSVDNVFSPIPSLRVSLELEEIDLEKLTGTLDFGHVSGILHGYIRDLVIVNGQAESFTASIESVKRKGVSQRINVEALRKISILGTGSSSSILDRGIYRFFKEYRYEKLGFRASLKNDRLRLLGVENRGNTGYLVKGGLLPPKVDVVSYNQDISFKEMVSRLKRVMSAQMF
ncbi:MAG: hypothetical protein GXP46_08305 [Deferribacteres bacterium]|nr:hypothetical protein [Deferribacteres bacterium]